MFRPGICLTLSNCFSYYKITCNQTLCQQKKLRSSTIAPAVALGTRPRPAATVDDLREPSGTRPPLRPLHAQVHALPVAEIARRADLPVSSLICFARTLHMGRRLRRMPFFPEPRTCFIQPYVSHDCLAFCLLLSYIVLQYNISFNKTVCQQQKAARTKASGATLQTGFLSHAPCCVIYIDLGGRHVRAGSYPEERT
jgi:hypothetical protein